MRTLVLPLLAFTATVCVCVETLRADGPFNNLDYTYTQLWRAEPTGGTYTYGRWPDYNAATGKLLWRDGPMNGYIADLNAATGAISNISQFAAGKVYEASFSPNGSGIFYQDTSSMTTLTLSGGGTVSAYKSYRYDVASAATSTIFDISTLPAATVESLTSYTGDEFGFYLSQGGSEDDVLMSVRAGTGQMEVVKYNINAKTFVNLTNSAQAEYDAQYFGTDTSKLLYWTESYSDHSVRTVSMLSDGVETDIASTTTPDMYLTTRWGNSQDEVLSVQGTSFTNCDLVKFTCTGGDWSSGVDLTGTGWSSSQGAIYAAKATGKGIVFGVRSTDASSSVNGLWYMQPVPEPSSIMLLIAGGLTALAAIKIRRRHAN